MRGKTTFGASSTKKSLPFHNATTLLYCCPV